MRKLFFTLLLLLSTGLAQAQNPYIQILSPQNGSQVGNRFTLRGTGPPNGSVVVTGAAQGQARVNRAGRWEMFVSTAGMPIGESVRLTVVGNDANGNPTRPVFLRYYAAYGNPSNNRVDMSVNLPANGSVVGNQFDLSGSGTPGALIEVSGTVNASGYINQQGYWNVRINTRGLASGTVMYLNVRARDNYGNYSRTVPVKYAKR